MFVVTEGPAITLATDVDGLPGKAGAGVGLLVVEPQIDGGTNVVADAHAPAMDVVLTMAVVVTTDHRLVIIIPDIVIRERGCHSR